MNVVFLDYDGVVNILTWEKTRDGRYVCNFNFPSDDCVNDKQAVQWVSEFCEEYGYKIVVSSTWRMSENYEACLRNSGLRDSVEVLGATPILHSTRAEEISQYLRDHPEITGYLVFDDEVVGGDHTDRLIRCDSTRGFGLWEHAWACAMHRKYNEAYGVRGE